VYFLTVRPARAHEPPQVGSYHDGIDLPAPPGGLILHFVTEFVMKQIALALWWRHALLQTPLRCVSSIAMARRLRVMFT